MSASKLKVPNVGDLFPSSRAGSSSHSSSNILPLPTSTPTPLSTPTPTRTTRPSSPLPRSPISVSRGEPLLSVKKDFDVSAVVAQKPTTPLRIAPAPEKTTMMSSYAEIVNSNSVETQLEAKKYVILDRIMVNEEDVQVHYVKAYDPNGVIVYVLMDTGGSLPVQHEDMKLLTVCKESKILTSDKMSALNCAGTGVCGVALICNNELCTILRNNDGSTTEKNYQSSLSLLNTGSSSVSHIVIRMSEIVADSEGVFLRSYEANERITRAIFHSAKESLNRASEKAKLLQKAIASFETNREAAYDRLERDRANLSAYTNKYYTQFIKGNLDAQADSMYVSASSNLYARNKIFFDLISITNTFIEEEDNLERICNMIIALNNNVVEKHHSTAKKILTEDEIMKL